MDVVSSLSWPSPLTRVLGSLIERLLFYILRSLWISLSDVILATSRCGFFCAADVFMSVSFSLWMIPFTQVSFYVPPEEQMCALTASTTCTDPQGALVENSLDYIIFMQLFASNICVCVCVCVCLHLCMLMCVCVCLCIRVYFFATILPYRQIQCMFNLPLAVNIIIETICLCAYIQVNFRLSLQYSKYWINTQRRKTEP